MKDGEIDPGSAGTASSGPEFIRWDREAMATGVEALDAEHRILIDRLNELYRAHHAGAGGPEIRKMLRFLAQYAKDHFSHEEGVMRQHKCPLALTNRDAHARFLHELEALQQRFIESGDPDEAATEIERMVGRWLVGHICRVDSSLRRCIEAEAKGGKT